MAQQENFKKTIEEEMSMDDNDIITNAEDINFDTETEPTTLLEAIDNVNQTISNFTGSFRVFDESYCHGNNLDYLAKRLHITPIQAALFSICIEEGPDNITFGDFSRTLNLSKARGMALATELDGLVRKKLLVMSKNYRGELCYNLPTRIIRVLTGNMDYQMPQLKAKNEEELLWLFRTYIEECTDENASSMAILEGAQEMLRANTRLKMVRELGKSNLSVLSCILILHLSDLLVNEEENGVSLYEIYNKFLNSEDLLRTRTKIRTGKHELFEQGYVEFLCSDGIVDTDSIKLTAKARKAFLSRFKLKETEEKADGLLHHTDIGAKELFYTEDVARQIDGLQHFLERERFNDIITRLNQRYHRGGLTCIMYGGPGTGKTETVYQLARVSGRDIMVVDVPSIKGKWVGESEKNIKAVFDRYRSLVERCEVAPILLFNEADAILGERLTNIERSVDKMENAIQNIILQEMENLNGIMIATTNLTENLDEAFERRFLYKIEFERPDADVRARIWHQMLPELTDNECERLGEYDLSGGQIENVARKYDVNIILYGEDHINRLKTLCELCSQEHLGGVNGAKRVGFRA